LTRRGTSNRKEGGGTGRRGAGGWGGTGGGDWGQRRGLLVYTVKREWEALKMRGGFCYRGRTRETLTWGVVGDGGGERGGR